MSRFQFTTAEQAVARISSGQRVFLHGACATPRVLLEALVRRAPELKDVELVHLHTEGPAYHADPAVAESFHPNAFFVASNLRKAVAEGRADYVPMFLSEIPNLFRRREMLLDAALVHVSPPDAHGFCSLGVSVDIAHAAIECAKTVIAQVNPRMPRTHGDALVHASKFAAMVAVDEPIFEQPREVPGEIERAIGRHAAGLIEDGATLQVGIGGIPDAVLAALANHRRLGVHTEMFSDGVVDLVESGAITGECKRTHPGKVVATFVMGTRRVFEFVHDNPLVAMLDAAYVNDTTVIRRNPRVTAVNSALEIDFTGQVCADSIGTRQYSGVGGQMDFIRGASLSENGRPIIALPSTTKSGLSRIVALLNPGAGVVTTRAHVQYVVTEYGAVNLRGLNLRQRARALIGIAHPMHREKLEQAARERFGRF